MYCNLFFLIISSIGEHAEQGIEVILHSAPKCVFLPHGKWKSPRNNFVFKGRFSASAFALSFSATVDELTHPIFSSDFFTLLYSDQIKYLVATKVFVAKFSHWLPWLT